MQWTAAALAATIILLTVLPWLRHEAWWVRVFDFPRVQIAILSTLMLAAYIAIARLDDALDWLVVGALVAAIGYQVSRIAVYTPLHPKQAKNAARAAAENCISLLVANVLMPNRNAPGLLRIVADRDPDLVLCVETDDWWQSKLDVLERTHPYAVKQPSDNLYGMHLYSKLELRDPEVKFLVEDGIPSIHADLVLRSGRVVKLHCVHPTPPSPTESPTSKERDAELLVVAKAVAAAGGSSIVLGDLNDVAWSATTRLFQKISGMLDPRIGRGTYSTFHAKYPFLRWPLDHIFFTSDFTVVSLERLPYFGSDHFPIHAALCHSPAAEVEQEEPQADAAERELAEEKIDKVEVQDEV